MIGLKKLHIKLILDDSFVIFHILSEILKIMVNIGMCNFNNLLLSSKERNFPWNYYIYNH